MIQRFPAFLQNFLQTKTRGRNPAEFSDVVVPTVDLSRFYEAGMGPDVRLAQQTLTGPNFGARLIVPDSESWLVHTVSFSGQATGALLSLLAIGQARLNAGGVLIRLSETLTFSAAVQPLAAGESVSVTWVPARPLIVSPGFEFLIEITRGANVACTTSALVTPISNL